MHKRMTMLTEFFAISLMRYTYGPNHGAFDTEPRLFEHLPTRGTTLAHVTISVLSVSSLTTKASSLFLLVQSPAVLKLGSYSLASRFICGFAMGGKLLSTLRWPCRQVSRCRCHHHRDLPGRCVMGTRVEWMSSLSPTQRKWPLDAILACRLQCRLGFYAAFSPHHLKILVRLKYY